MNIDEIEREHIKEKYIDIYAIKEVYDYIREKANMPRPQDIEDSYKEQM